MTVLTSPKGKAIFPHLTEKDTMFHPEGLFHVKLECPKAESEKILSAIKNGIAQEVKKQHDQNPNKAIKYAPEPYEVQDEKVVFNFKLKACGVRKSDNKPFTQKPIISNADLSAFDQTMQIWGDSILKIHFLPTFWNMPIGIGCTLRLKEVQVLELVTGNTSSSKADFKVEPMVAPKVKTEEEAQF